MKHLLPALLVATLIGCGRDTEPEPTALPSNAPGDRARVQGDTSGPLYQAEEAEQAEQAAKSRQAGQTNQRATTEQPPPSKTTQTAQTAQTTQTAQTDRAAQTASQQQLQKSEDLIGAEVQNAKGEKIAEIEDFAYDPESGKISYAAVATGGFLEMGEKKVAVAMSELHFSQEDSSKVFTSSLTQEQLESAPELGDNWPSSPQLGEAQNQPQQNQKIQRASQTVGKQIVNEQGEELGTVKNLAMDLSSGTVPYAAVELDEKTVAVPIQTISISSSQAEDKLTLAGSRQNLQNAPAIEGEQWPAPQAWGAETEQKTTIQKPDQTQPEARQPSAQFSTTKQGEQDVEIEIQADTENQQAPQPQTQQREPRRQPANPEAQPQQTDRQPQAAITRERQQPDQARQAGGESATFVLNEEQLNVQTEQISAGGVLIKTVIKEEPANESVTLRTEEVVIERLSPEQAQQHADSAKGKAASEGNAFEAREIFIPLMREKAVVTKESAVHEIVRIQKQVQSEEREIQESLRREELQVERNVDPEEYQQASAQERAQGGQSAVQQGAGQSGQDAKSLKQRVEQQLKQQDSISNKQLQNIQIEVQKDTVILKGKIDSQEAKQSIGKAAQQVNGVKNVRNDLEISQQKQNQNQKEN